MILDKIRRTIRLSLSLFVVFLLAGCSHKDGQQDAEQESNHASALMKDGDYLSALPLLNRAIDVFTEVKSDSGSAEAYLLEGECYRNLGRYDTALTCYEHAIEHAQSNGTQKLERKGRLALAEFYFLIHDNAAAWTLASDALGSAKVLNDVNDMYAALHTATRAAHRLGKFDNEISLLSELIELDKTMYGGRSKPELLEQQLVAYAAAGDYAGTRSFWNRWRNESVPASDSSNLVRLYSALADAQLEFGFPDSALRSYSRALDLLGLLSGSYERIHILTALGNLAYRSHHYDNARRYYTDALKDVQQQDDLVDAQMIGGMLVACEWRLSGATSGMTVAELLKRSTAMQTACEQAGFQMGEAFASFLRGRIIETNFGADSAVGEYEKALELYEVHPSSSGTDPDVQSIINTFLDADQLGWYDPLLQRACTRNDLADAFTLLERKNLRDIIRFFTELSITTPSGKTNDAIRLFQRQYHYLQLATDDLLAEWRRPGGKRLAIVSGLKAEIPRYRDQILAAANALDQVDSRFRCILSPKPFTLRQIRESLSPHAGLLEYVHLTNMIYLLVATPDSQYLKKVPTNDSHLQEVMHEYLRLLSGSGTGGSGSRRNELSTVLANQLIDPVRSLLDSSVYIVPPTDFGWLPFHTLLTGSEPLIDRVNVCYLPTALVLLFPRQQPVYVSDIVGIGHPGKTTWDVEYELKDIRGFYDKARMLFTSSATLDRLDSLRYQLIHVAAEFHLNTRIPDRSVAVLSDGQTPFGLQEAPLGEMLKIPTPQTLVFSNITPTPGELSRYMPLAYLADGVSTVITTMWQGERKGKKYFGEVFYTSIQIGTPAPIAYRDAMRALTRRPEFQSPDHWGLYYCFGR